MMVFKLAVDAKLRHNGWRKDANNRWFHPANPHVRCLTGGDAFVLTSRMQAIVEMPQTMIAFSNNVI